MTGHVSLGSRRPIPLAFAVALVCLAAAPAYAQDQSPDPGTDAPPAHISFVDGAAILERDGRPDTSPLSMPLLAGDRVRTETGRVEVLFADGSALHLDNHTVVDFQSDEVVRLIEGRMRLSIAGRGRDVAYRVDAPGGWVQIAEGGEYRIAVLRGEREPQVELAVLRGAAELANEDGRSVVRAGERAFARVGAQPSPPYVFNSAAWDAFDRWSEGRRDQRLGVSAQYLPPDVHPYSATFDQHGSWRYEQVHGYVWYPRVQVGWRPYYRGRWVSLRPYGWTWIAGDPWGWPTHHYGRWGTSAGSWFWIPGRRWGAAWVSWAYAPDYVSWCPLGWNDRPVFSFINVNVHSYGRRYDPWHAWTVVPRRHFGAGFVHANVVAGGRFDSRTHRSFVVRDSAPEWRHAVPRASSAIRTAGRTGYAVPRGSARSVVSGDEARGGAAAGPRSLPAPARQPRIPGTDAAAPSRSPAPITSAPQRAVPRDRRIDRDTLSSPTDRSAVAIPEVRRSDDVRAPESRRRMGDPTTVPPTGSRAMPRSLPGADSPRAAEPAWGRYDRPAAVQPPRNPTESPRDNDSRPNPGYRRGPEQSGSSERYRAVPRQDAPPPSSSERPRESPRSYSAPERRAPSSPSPSADRPSRSAPSGDGGQSRSRGDQPSRGQARPRGGG